MRGRSRSDLERLTREARQLEKRKTIAQLRQQLEELAKGRSLSFQSVLKLSRSYRLKLDNNKSGARSITRDTYIKEGGLNAIPSFLFTFLV